MKYKRILLKLSGESLQGEQKYGLSPAVLQSYAEQIRDAAASGVQIGIVIGGSLLGLDRGRRGLAHRIDYLGLNNGRHLFLRLAELTDGTADCAAHLWELIRAKQQKAEDHDDRELTLSNTKHTYLQGSM